MFNNCKIQCLSYFPPYLDTDNVSIPVGQVSPDINLISQYDKRAFWALSIVSQH